MSYDPIGMEKRLNWIQKQLDRLDPADFGTMTPSVIMYARQNADHLMGDLDTLERYYNKQVTPAGRKRGLRAR